MSSSQNGSNGRNPEARLPLVPSSAPAFDRRGTSRRPSSTPAEPAADEWDALEDIARTLTTSGWYRVVRRFRRRERYASPTPATVRSAVYVDVETTGLDATNDRIIELALVPFEYDDEGTLYAVGEPLSFFEDPEMAIPPKVTALTGIDDGMVRGTRIDDGQVNELLSTCGLVIAHNAEFDRKFVERRLPSFASAYWACSQREVPWSEFGCGAAALEYLMFRMCGEFHDGHRAADDCFAGIHLLAEPRLEGRSAMSFLRESARDGLARVWAVDAAIEMKDVLKARRYRWNSGLDGRPKAWYKDVRWSLRSAEQEWLRDAVYGASGDTPVRVDKITARDRYSVRV